MELHADDRIAANDGGQRAAVIGRGDHVPVIGSDVMEGMDEIGVLAVFPGRDAVEHRMGAAKRGPLTSEPSTRSWR